MLTTTLINTTCMFVLVLGLIAITASLARFARLSLLVSQIQLIELRVRASGWIHLILLAGTLLGISSRLYLSYLAPGDILQDTISARQVLQGGSAYPSDLNQMVRAEVRKHPPSEPLSNRFPRLKQLQSDQMPAALLNIVNGHPPLFTLALVPLVLRFGIYMPALFVNAVALLLFAYAAFRIQSLLFPDIGRRAQVIVMVLCLGWQPVIASVRHANPSLLISGLILLCWWLLRIEKYVLSGLVLGLAIALKIYPCLLLVYLLIRYRRTFVSAVIATASLTIFVLLVLGPDEVMRFVRTTSMVTQVFGVARNNLSVFSAIFGLTNWGGASSFQSLLEYGIIGFVSLAAGAVLLQCKDGSSGTVRNIDLDYSIFICIICLFSPIVWPHYLSMLLLPLAVILKQSGGGPYGSNLKAGLLLVTAVLSLPDQPVRAWSEMLESHLGHPLGWLLGSIQTFSVLALFAWLWWLRLAPKRSREPLLSQAAAVAR
jgi:hypothetical protein